MVNMVATVLLPDRIKTILENVLTNHIKYLNDDSIEVKIKIGKVEMNCDFYDILYNAAKETKKGLDQKLIRNRVQEIIDNVENREYSKEKLLIFNLLQKAHEGLSNLEKQRYLHSLLQGYFQSASKEIASLTQELFSLLVKQLMPFIKLQFLLHHMTTEEGVTQYLIEFLECVCCPLLTREDCYEIIYNKYGMIEYDFINFKMIPVDEELGYLGDYYNLKININHTKEEVLNLFAKYITSNMSRTEVAKYVFMKEEFVYKVLIPMFKQYGIGGLCHFATDCYLSKTNECLILDDITKCGYTMSNDIRIIPEYEWVVMVAKKMSSLHACSILLEERLFVEFGKKIHLGDIFGEFLEDSHFDKTKPNGMGYDIGIKTIHQFLIRKLSHICTKIPVEEFEDKIIKEVEKRDGKRSKDYCNVVLHGDTWGRNILANDSMDCILLDYQLVKYCPPADDLLLLIYFNTDRHFRFKYMDEIIKIYYDTLQHNLNLYNFDINTVYTRDKFLESINYHKNYAIMDALVGFQLILLPENIKERVTEEELLEYYFKDRTTILNEAWNDDIFRTRVSDLIQDLNDNHVKNI